MFLSLLANSCPRPTRTPRQLAQGEPRLIVMTYNINYGLAGDSSILETIRKSQADVVFLQETSIDWEAAIRAGLSGLYPHMGFRSGSGAGGLAVLSRLPFEEKEIIPPPDGGWFPAWLVILETPLGRVQSLNVHLRPQIGDSGSVVSGYLTMGDIRLRQIRHFLSRLDLALPTLIVGDFNESRTGDAVEHLAKMGMQSALVEFSPYEKTWRWRTSVGTVSAQLDHIVYNQKLEPTQVWVTRSGRSDHLPVMGVFVRSKTGARENSYSWN